MILRLWPWSYSQSGQDRNNRKQLNPKSSRPHEWIIGSRRKAAFSAASATLLTLFVLPALYVRFGRGERVASDEIGAKQHPAAAE